MTKTEFREQFKRLRMAGYRLPVFDGITVDNVLDEWFATFGGCSEREFGQAIDRLKQKKTDTFWPATGELWFHIFEIRKGDRIRRQANDHGGEWHMSDEESQAFLAMLRQTRDKILRKMPDAAPQTRPQGMLDDEALAREDRVVNGEE